MIRTVELPVRVLGYDVRCAACGWQQHLTPDLLEAIEGHHAPMLLAVHMHTGQDPVPVVWVCRRPRPLRRRYR